MGAHVFPRWSWGRNPSSGSGKGGGEKRRGGCDGGANIPQSPKNRFPKAGEREHLLGLKHRLTKQKAADSERRLKALLRSAHKLVLKAMSASWQQHFQGTIYRIYSRQWSMAAAFKGDKLLIILKIIVLPSISLSFSVWGNLLFICSEKCQKTAEKYPRPFRKWHVGMFFHQRSQTQHI